MVGGAVEEVVVVGLERVADLYVCVYVCVCAWVYVCVCMHVYVCARVCV